MRRLFKENRQIGCVLFIPYNVTNGGKLILRFLFIRLSSLCGEIVTQPEHTIREGVHISCTLAPCVLRRTIPMGSDTARRS